MVFAIKYDEEQDLIMRLRKEHAMKTKIFIITLLVAGMLGQSLSVRAQGPDTTAGVLTDASGDPLVGTVWEEIAFTDCADFGCLSRPSEPEESTNTGRAAFLKAHILDNETVVIEIRNNNFFLLKETFTPRRIELKELRLELNEDQQKELEAALKVELGYRVATVRRTKEGIMFSNHKREEDMALASFAYARSSETIPYEFVLGLLRARKFDPKKEELPAPIHNRIFIQAVYIIPMMLKNLEREYPKAYEVLVLTLKQYAEKKENTPHGLFKLALKALNKVQESKVPPTEIKRIVLHSFLDAEALNKNIPLKELLGLYSFEVGPFTSMKEQVLKNFLLAYVTDPTKLDLYADTTFWGS